MEVWETWGDHKDHSAQGPEHPGFGVSQRISTIPWGEVGTYTVFYQLLSKIFRPGRIRLFKSSFHTWQNRSDSPQALEPLPQVPRVLAIAELSLLLLCSWEATVLHFFPPSQNTQFALPPNYLGRVWVILRQLSIANLAVLTNILSAHFCPEHHLPDNLLG